MSGVSVSPARVVRRQRCRIQGRLLCRYSCVCRRMQIDSCAHVSHSFIAAGMAPSIAQLLHKHDNDVSFFSTIGIHEFCYRHEYRCQWSVVNSSLHRCSRQTYMLCVVACVHELRKASLIRPMGAMQKSSTPSVYHVNSTQRPTSENVVERLPCCGCPPSEI